jgi:hypothetical protein
MLEVRGYADFGEEAIDAEHRRDLGLHDLDRHASAVPRVLGLVDRRHATRSDFALDAVPVGKCAVQLRDGLHEAAECLAVPGVWQAMERS